MAFMSFGYRVSSRVGSFVQGLGPVPEDFSKVLFAGWTSYVIEDREGQATVCGESSGAETELLRLCSLATSNYKDEIAKVDLQSTSTGSVRSNKALERRRPVKLYGWDALQGFLSPEGYVVALCLNDNTAGTGELYTPRQVYTTAIDVGSCGSSTDYCTVVVDRQTGGLYHWTLSDPVPKELGSKTVKFTRVWAGEAHFLALDEGGTLYSWGSSRHGQLGNGDLVSKTSPEPVEPLEGIRIVDAACGASFSVALSDTGDVYTFGLNDHGQLGIGKAEGKQGQGHERCNTALPQLVDFFEDSKGNHGQGQGVSPIEVSVVKVACGHSHAVVLDDEGRVWSCGWGKYGQLGQGESSSTSPPPSDLGEMDRQKEEMDLLRSMGSIMVEGDRYLFGPLVESGGKQVWTDVCCGRWDTFVWSEGSEVE
ncbi:regulator of chromosome condensation 1/beta-lactamase-inhibitor protein II [Linnemannia elongata]|nr:regulator of chromosome condensation 1/beta-lactamase-inhibitor protein II [Linnemannia elongata]